MFSKRSYMIHWAGMLWSGSKVPRAHSITFELYATPCLTDIESKTSSMRNPRMILTTKSIGFVAYVLGQVIYNLYFHPLRNYPGPFWARASLLWRLLHSMDGRFHRYIEICHKRYGDVFRVSPDELSFCTPTAWTDIYGTSTKGVTRIVKNEFYEVFSAGFEAQSIGTERDPIAAQQKRALFSTALSVRGLARQEPIMQKHIDIFVQKLGRLGNNEKGIDMSKWFIYAAFDITGQMSFGESFGCVEREASHPWLDLILELMYGVTVMDNLRRVPLVVVLVKYIPRKWTERFKHRMMQFVKEKTAARLQKPEGQNDFLEVVADKTRKGEITLAEMEAHSWNMAACISLAGAETSGTSMTSTLYFILKTPEVYQKLVKEVRSAHTSYEEIDMTTATQLEYLMAVLKEGLRMFPVAAQGTPRRSPGATVDGYYVPKGMEIYVSPWAVSHDKRFWDEPYAFKPERWIDPNCKDVKSASQPFSLGSRVCPGKLFAYGQMALELAKMVYVLDMELVDQDLDWINTCKMHFLWWKPELNVRFRPREIGA
ncbi:cytochrome P450 [Xylariaceae sp. AK1471]|nr:cytochrome P450 [Xylariaceae sp. AK1471]